MCYVGVYMLCVCLISSKINLCLLDVDKTRCNQNVKTCPMARKGVIHMCLFTIVSCVWRCCITCCWCSKPECVDFQKLCLPIFKKRCLSIVTSDCCWLSKASFVDFPNRCVSMFKRNVCQFAKASFVDVLKWCVLSFYVVWWLLYVRLRIFSFCFMYCYVLLCICLRRFYCCYVLRMYFMYVLCICTYSLALQK
jgi:hypothetical protein